MSIVLNEQQLAARKSIISIIDDKNAINRLIVLEGYAGTGKTTLIHHLIEELNTTLRITYDNIIVATFTNKAAKVAEDAVLGKVRCVTLHRLFRLEPNVHLTRVTNVDKVTNKHTSLAFKYDDRKAPEIDASLIIIDEFSTVDNDMLTLIDNAYRYDRSLIVIMMGDSQQLKPVGHKIGDELPLFKFIKQHSSRYNVMVLSRLTQLMRCNDRLSHYYKFFINVFEQPGLMLQLKRAYPYASDDERLSTGFMHIYDIDRSVIITYSNERKNTFNRLVKEALEGERYRCTLDEFVSGFYFNICDHVMLENHVIMYRYDVHGGVLSMDTSEAKTLYNGERYEIESITPVRIKLGLSYVNDGHVNGYYVGLRHADTTVHVPVITHVERRMLTRKIRILMALLYIKKEQYIANEMTDYGHMHDIMTEVFGRVSYDDITALRKRSIPKTMIGTSSDKHDIRIMYRALKQLLTDIDRQMGTLTHAYAITLYKSQGSTYKHVILDMNDIDRCCYNLVAGTIEDKCRSYYCAIYVGVTRASDAVHYLI